MRIEWLVMLIPDFSSPLGCWPLERYHLSSKLSLFGGNHPNWGYFMLFIYIIIYIYICMKSGFDILLLAYMYHRHHKLPTVFFFRCLSYIWFGDFPASHNCHGRVLPNHIKHETNGWRRHIPPSFSVGKMLIISWIGCPMFRETQWRDRPTSPQDNSEITTCLRSKGWVPPTNWHLVCRA